jgi:1-acyl-sn-glycerol-3-phosphate acyltransferase
VTLPPPWVRRPVLGAAVIFASLTMFTSIPLWLIVAAFASRWVPGRWRPIRLLWFLFVWLALESVVLIALFGLWVGSGFGWRIRSEAFQSAHYALMAWFLRRVIGSARLTFGLSFDVEAEGEPQAGERPMIIMARHAGPGDSLILVHAVLNRLGRRPRVVLKDTLQWDPAIDTLLNRLPSKFVSTGGGASGATEAIAEMARSMDGDDALIIFPEGGNFTPGRRDRAITRLEEAGHHEFAARARAMEHLLPPKPGGIVAAVTAAPDSLVVLVGHSGMEDMDTPAEVWRGLEMDRVIHTRIWIYPAEDLPAAVPDLGVWLYDQWHQMNTWIGGRRASGAND